MMLLFPNEIFYLLKPADNQRIVQVLRKLVVLNVVGSNPTSHPKEKSSVIIDCRGFFVSCVSACYGATLGIQPSGTTAMARSRVTALASRLVSWRLHAARLSVVADTPVLAYSR